MIEFLLNDKYVVTHEKPGSTLLDFIRYQKRLVGTKIGCREGDCGACTLLMGELINGKVVYKSLTSCITPLGNAHGKHIVSIEGLNMSTLTPYQQAMVDESGSQCGFCTPGFIVSFAGECLSNRPSTYESVIGAIDGNICRCTGYKSIERAAKKVSKILAKKNLDDLLPWLVKNNFIPAYFERIPNYLRKINAKGVSEGKLIVGGGTDLLVQKHDEIHETNVELFSDNKDLIGIYKLEDDIVIKSATNTTQLLESQVMNEIFPHLYEHLKLVSSTPIRNIATIAGNFINASPIGDLTAFFLALDTRLILKNATGNPRTIKLKDLYLGYKNLDMSNDEYVDEIRFPIPLSGTKFNFEKVSKRRYLDIASVNSALSILVEDGYIKEIHASAGGVGPTPKYLDQTCDFLRGIELNEKNIKQACGIVDSEISPISDARGSKEYKSLLLRQLFLAHFIELFPNKFKLKALA